MTKQAENNPQGMANIADDRVLATVYISDLVSYNEYDHACNGGYFRCPHCENQEYVSESEHGKIDECSRCRKQFMFNGC